MGTLSKANASVMKELLSTSLSEGTPYRITKDYIEEQLANTNASDQKFALLSNMLANITTQFTIQAMESSRSVALEDLFYDLKMRQLELELLKAQAQVDLATAEIAFNKARTALVTAQTASEAEKTKNIKRERYAIDDNLRIKEAEMLANVCSAYAAGGVAVPQDMKTTMLNKINEIVSKATKVL